MDREQEISFQSGDSVRGGPTWRGFVLSIVVAIVLSVLVTLLLGGSGSFGLRPGATASKGCGGGNCCPIPEDAK